MIHMRTLVLFAVAAVFVEATIQLESSTVSLVEPQFYTLYQNWLPEACSKTGINPGICADPRSSKNHRFVLDGLGLHGPGDLVYEFCSGPPLHSADLPGQTQSELSFYWPEAIAGSSWQGAWWSWGRCLNLSASEYFDMALRLHQNTETPELRDFLTVSVGREVEAYRIAEAYGSKSAILLCQENTTLVAILTCWNKTDANSSSERMSCPLNLQAAQTCGPKVYINALPENPKQSHLATAIYVIQYTVLDYRFFQSFIGDRSNRGTSRVFAKRTAIQVFAMLHASTGVFSELWAIYLDAGGEIGLAMWPWLSMVELASNLGISVVMLSWYSFVCSSLGRVKRWHAYACTIVCIAVVLAWAGVYMRHTIDVMRSRNIKNMELLPNPSLSSSYYVIYVVLELLCLIIVFQLLDGLHRRPSIKRVFLLNLISFIDSVIMLLVYIPQVQIFIFTYWPDWHSWTMCALFFIRYVTVSFLIEPITNCDANDVEAETANALHFGPSLSYRFEQGRALVVCNSDHARCQLDTLDNAVDASRFVTALEYIGFVVTLRTDLDSAELLSYFEEMVNEAIAGNAHGIAFAFTGHGEVDSIYGVDGEEVLIPKIQSMCSRLDDLVPKLFFFECCRGRSSETRRSRRSESSWVVPLRFCQGTQNPSANANCLACYAQPRYFITRGAGEFTRHLCEKIQRLADEGDHDIEDALKMAGWEVIRMIIGLGRRQCPTYESSLTRRFVLKSQARRNSSADPVREMLTANAQPNSSISMQDLREHLV